MKTPIAALLFLLVAVPVYAAGQNYAADSTTYFSKPYADIVNATKTPQTTGTVAYCNNCSIAPVCTTGGTGAIAENIAGIWNCGNPSSNLMCAPVGPAGGGLGGFYPNPTVNGVVNVQSFGATPDGTTDDTAAIKSAVSSLGATGGTVVFPAGTASYTFSSGITIPKNVMLQCGGAPNSTVLSYTGTTGAALIWSSPPLGVNPSDYYMGGWKDCELSGPGAATSTIGIYTGGDPAGVITPAANYGDFLTFWGGKIQNFGTGYQVGDNVWENRFYSTIISATTTGYLLPNNIVQPGENMSMIGGSIQNTINDVVCNNPNADVVFTNTSFDGGDQSPTIHTGPAIRAGNVTGSQQGCGVTLQNDHFEYFGNSIIAPIFSEWGAGPFTGIKIRGGVIQLDDATNTLCTGAGAPNACCTGVNTGTCGFTMPAIADVTGGRYSVPFELEGMRISSGGDLHFTNTCKLGGPHMCISGDDAVIDALIKNYGYWQNGTADVTFPANSGNPGPSRQWGPILFSSTTTNADHFGMVIFDSPVVLNRMSIAYNGTCTTYPSFTVSDTTSGLVGGGCAAAAGYATCLTNAGAQAAYINGGDKVQIITASNAAGCTAGSNFYVTMEYRP